MSWYGWRPYVSAAQRRARTARKMQRLRKQGVDIQPVQIQGRKIAHTFWGEAWCAHLEKFSDFANRLPRGRTYVRNGSVCHLEIAKNRVTAMVSGTMLYNVKIGIKQLPRKKWAEVKKRCAGQIGSMVELLQGRLSQSVMSVVTDRERGLFPLPREIEMHCSCPDWAVMCKHVAAVLYGVGARLDQRPELLFLLRGVDYQELIAAGATSSIVKAGAGRRRRRIAEESLEEVFGIDLAPASPKAAGKKKTAKKPAATARKAAPRKKARRAKRKK